MKQMYVPYHVHTQHSNGTTNIDSVTKYQDYIAAAKDCEMPAIAFSEHGNLFEWYFKKCAAEESGLKYIHAVEAYITFDDDISYTYMACKARPPFSKNKYTKIYQARDEKWYGIPEDPEAEAEEIKPDTIEKELRKTKDNYHCVLLARNEQGVREINTLMSDAWNREDNHYYYVPRIYFKDLIQTTENVLITTACLGGILNKGTPEIKEKFLNFLTANRDRCWLEIQHHNCEDQKHYNQLLWEISKQTGIRLIAATDTHCLNQTHAKGRSLLQKAKNIHFADEDQWDLVFKTPDELAAAFMKQDALPEEVWTEAMHQTLVMADMIEDFTIDTNPKYPRLFDNSKEVLLQKIEEGIEKKHLRDKPNWPEYEERINHEIDTYEHNDMIDFLLLDEDYKRAMREKGVIYGPGRGSVSGSIVAYLLEITSVDSVKYGLNFERFANKERVSLGDIDSDFASTDRDTVKEYLYSRYPGSCCEIVTFNTIATRGAIDDVCRALYKDSLTPSEYMAKSNEIKKLAETNEEKARKKFPEVFEYVDIVNGCIVSVGTHPSATLVFNSTVKDYFSTFTTKTCTHPVSVLKMKEVDKIKAVKLDILTIENINVIKQACQMAGIPPLDPDNLNFEDEKVWQNIREDTTMIFQLDSELGEPYVKRLFSDSTIAKMKSYDKNFSYLNLMSMGSAALRPSGASYRDQLANGVAASHGCKPLDDFYRPTQGYCLYQETIMAFLHEFCGFTMGQADLVRRGLAKKVGTEQYIPEIRAGFIDHMQKEFGYSIEESEELLESTLQVIEDASEYGFSLNHSLAYSMITFMTGYLRLYYPLEFLTASFNVYGDDKQRVGKLVNYAKKRGIDIRPVKFRKSSGDFFFDREENAIYKGTNSINGMGEKASDDLYAMRDQSFVNFMDLLIYAKQNCHNLDSGNLQSLAALNYFSEFGDANQLLRMIEVFKALYGKKKLKADGTTLAKVGLSNREFAYEIQAAMSKATAKEYTVDMNKFLISIAQKLRFIPQNSTDLILAQYKSYGSIDYVNPTMKNTGVVLECDAKRQPRLKVYSIRTGKIQDAKIYKEQYKKCPLDKGDLLRIDKIEYKPKNIMLENGCWGKSDTEKELYIKAYQKVDSF